MGNKVIQNVVSQMEKSESYSENNENINNSTSLLNGVELSGDEENQSHQMPSSANANISEETTASLRKSIVEPSTTLTTTTTTTTTPTKKSVLTSSTNFVSPLKVLKMSAKSDTNGLYSPVTTTSNSKSTPPPESESSDYVSSTSSLKSSSVSDPVNMSWSSSLPTNASLASIFEATFESGSSTDSDDDEEYGEDKFEAAAEALASEARSNKIDIVTLEKQLREMTRLEVDRILTGEDAGGLLAKRLRLLRESRSSSDPKKDEQRRKQFKAETQRLLDASKHFPDENNAAASTSASSSSQSEPSVVTPMLQQISISNTNTSTSTTTTTTQTSISPHMMSLSSSASQIAFNNNNTKFSSDFKIPPRLEYLLDMPQADYETQVMHSWNPDDRSLNIFVKESDPFTLHRHPVAQSTDCIRTKFGYTKGIHLFELNWNSRQRGTHAIIGVAMDKSPLHCVGYQSLIGSNPESWGWDLGRNRACHNTKATNQPPPVYPRMLKPDESFVVPDNFFMCLDMDEGTLSFMADGQFLGVAFRGLRGKKVHPIVSAVWGHCEITMKYVNGLDPNPLPLTDLCRRTIRQTVGKQRINDINKLPLPNALKNFLLYKK